METNELKQAREAYANGYYEMQLEVGLRFQDVATRVLYQRGIVVVGYASRRAQMDHGENMLGAEIKRDGQFRETGNLYIETAEKAHPNRVEYAPSGIYRGDNSWLLVIGDETTIWIFSTKYLRMLEDRYRHKTIATSRGFLIPLADADKYCIRRIDIEGGAP
ncbi:MAG TPA: hypothetical protein VMW24_06015 [Sedimentisphaerales bacterium]|nr:hypothetical protein [Sedimentisphaerales bacterium]